MLAGGRPTSMKYQLAGLTLTSLFLFAAMALLRPHAQASPRTPGAARTPVVVELFTSEGCSSCPPADALLARLAEEPLAGNVQLIALEEHVDYWNDLGWADPFSSRDWTSRQNVYSGALGNGNPYTPQMVVDGTVEFVGSHGRKARQAILEAAGKTKIPVTLGENGGEDLHHAAVVRFMRKIGEANADGDISFDGDASVPLQREWKRENLRAVLLVQDKKSRRILGAAEIRIAP